MASVAALLENLKWDPSAQAFARFNELLKNEGATAFSQYLSSQNHKQVQEVVSLFVAAVAAVFPERPSTSTEDSSAAQQQQHALLVEALRSVGHWLRLSALASLIPANIIDSIFGRISPIVMSSTSKSVATWGLWMFAIQSLPADRLKPINVERVLDAVSSAHQRFSASVSLRLEILQVVSKLLSQVPGIVCGSPFAEKWLGIVLFTTVDTQADVRLLEKAESILTTAWPLLTSSDPQRGSAASSEISVNLIESGEMTRILEAVDGIMSAATPTAQQLTSVLRLWSRLVHLLGAQITRNNLINALLRIPEKTCLNEAASVRAATLDAWRALIDNFGEAQRGHLLIKKRVTLLLIPLKVGLDDVEALVRESAARSWRYLVEAVARAGGFEQPTETHGSSAQRDVQLWGLLWGEDVVSLLAASGPDQLLAAAARVTTATPPACSDRVMEQQMMPLLPALVQALAQAASGASSSTAEQSWTQLWQHLVAHALRVKSSSATSSVTHLIQRCSAFEAIWPASVSCVARVAEPLFDAVLTSQADASLQQLLETVPALLNLLQRESSAGKKEASAALLSRLRARLGSAPESSEASDADAVCRTMAAAVALVATRYSPAESLAWWQLTPALLRTACSRRWLGGSCCSGAVGSSPLWQLLQWPLAMALTSSNGVTPAVVAPVWRECWELLFSAAADTVAAAAAETRLDPRLLLAADWSCAVRALLTGSSQLPSDAFCRLLVELVTSVLRLVEEHCVAPLALPWKFVDATATDPSAAATSAVQARNNGTACYLVLLQLLSDLVALTFQAPALSGACTRAAEALVAAVTALKEALQVGRSRSSRAASRLEPLIASVAVASSRSLFDQLLANNRPSLEGLLTVLFDALLADAGELDSAALNQRLIWLTPFLRWVLSCKLRSIKNSAIEYWKKYVRHASSLEYPAELQPILLAIKEKVDDFPLPGFGATSPAAPAPAAVSIAAKKNATPVPAPVESLAQREDGVASGARSRAIRKRPRPEDVAEPAPAALSTGPPQSKRSKLDDPAGALTPQSLLSQLANADTTTLSSLLKDADRATLEAALLRTTQLSHQIAELLLNSSLSPL